uniref:HVA22-like protein n=1 Tax=Anthurium amnicola TaxID=1678845 RepID=A0A1D1XK12_9ARAE
MLGEFVTGILVLLLGYAYPSFECFRVLEQNRPEIEQLRFWCQYWIIMGLLTALERFGDMFVSWLPLYGEVKLAFIIYLWHPRTKGTWYIYNKFIMPCLASNEPRISRKLNEVRTKSGDLLLFYIKNFTEKGQSIAFDLLQYVVKQTPGPSDSQGGPPPSSRGSGSPPPPQPSAPPLPTHQPTRSRRRASQSRREEADSMHEDDQQDGVAEIERIIRDSPFSFLRGSHRQQHD